MRAAAPLCCPLCGAQKAQAIFRLDQVPVICNQLWPDPAAARTAPAGTVDLQLCRDCSFIWNSAFEPDRMVYAPGYENALHFSPRFQAFAAELAAGLVARYGLTGKHVIEIGCGDGHMLDLLAQNGVASATGFDPSMAGVTSPFTARDTVEIVGEYFRSDQLDRPCDAILCRHVLEHLDDPVALLRDIRRAIGDREVPVYFEVPNAGWMLEAVSMWDVIYEHVGYWSAPALTALFRRTGFEPLSVRTGYGAQFLMIEAVPAAPQEDYLDPGAARICAAAQAFAEAAGAEVQRWRRRLRDCRGKVVIWGAGSKGITFANAMGEAAPGLCAFVDLNSRKHQRIAPGVALPVIAPEQLASLRPELVLISNALYEEEIIAQLRAAGLHPDFAVIAG